MTPRMLEQLSWLFECEAAALIDTPKPPTDEALVEADRLRDIAGELAARASELGQQTGVGYCFGEVGS